MLPEESLIVPVLVTAIEPPPSTVKLYVNASVAFFSQLFVMRNVTVAVVLLKLRGFLAVAFTALSAVTTVKTLVPSLLVYLYVNANVPSKKLAPSTQSPEDAAALTGTVKPLRLSVSM